MREKVMQIGLEDVLSWLDNDNGEVAIFDATNTTRERRSYLYNRVVVEKGLFLFNCLPLIRQYINRFTELVY